MHRKNKSDSPKNATQLYIDGIRYRSIFDASIDTGMSFSWLCRCIKLNGGAPTKIHKTILVVAEKWILSHPEWLLQTIGGNIDPHRSNTATNFVTVGKAGNGA